MLMACPPPTPCRCCAGVPGGTQGARPGGVAQGWVRGGGGAVEELGRGARACVCVLGHVRAGAVACAGVSAGIC